MNKKPQKNAATPIAGTWLCSGLAWAVHATLDDPLLFCLAIALTVIGLVQTGMALFGPEEAQKDM